MFGSDRNMFTPFFRNIDNVRQNSGRSIDTAITGYQTSAFRIICDTEGMTVREYGLPRDSTPVLLILPAPIKSSGIWDLTPQTSIVRYCLSHNMGVYMIDWKIPEERFDFGLYDYADRFIGDALKAVAEETGLSRIFMAGHSLGGTLAAIYSSLHPDMVNGLVLLGSPLHFGRDAGGILDILIADLPDAAKGIADQGTVPGSFIGLAAGAADPLSFGFYRLTDFMRSMFDEQALYTHMMVERWMLDELPMHGRLFKEVIENLYRKDRFMRGKLSVGNRVARPQAIRAPVYNVVDARSSIVPPNSSIPFLELTQSDDIEFQRYPGDYGVSLQHVGMLVGRSARECIWPAIRRWIFARST